MFIVAVCAVGEWAEPTLELHRISRLDMGAYLCIATNSVPPSVSKRIKVSVDCKCTYYKRLLFVRFFRFFTLRWLHGITILY